MHRAVKPYCQKLLAQGYERVFVLPYPYQRGHLRLRDGQGQESFCCFPDELLIRAVAPYQNRGVPVMENPSDAFWIASTYARLLFPKRETEMILDAPLRLLLRLCLDGDRPGMAQQALTLLGQLYPDYLANGQAGGLLYGCSVYLCDRFAHFC